jgi:ubiquinone/menaquinone biosynthesis C-methylase UbiE
MSLASKLKYALFSPKEKDPEKAYNLWAAGYDNQPGNLMLDLDEQVFSDIINNLQVTGKTIADIGCGTGRHWPKLIALQPGRLAGYDVSAGMLGRLNEKFPGAVTYLLRDELLPELPDASCDIIISTLTIAHIEKIETALQEWNRVLKKGGEVVITDYHPLALTKGGKRTFSHGGKTIAVKNYIHPVEKIKHFAGQLGWTTIRFTERIIDDSVKSYYEQQNALSLFEAYWHVPIIYGIHLKKNR